MERADSTYQRVEVRAEGTSHLVPRTLRFFPPTCVSALCYLLSALACSLSALSDLAAQQLDRSEIPTPISERSLPLRFEHLSINDGLTQNTVHGILQDHHGFMWLTTQHGLNRFDGYDVKQYVNIPFDSTSITGEAWLFDLAEDPEGQIWITTLGDGVNRLDPMTGKVERMQHDPGDPHSLSSDMAYDVIADRSGQIWIATGEGGLCRFDEVDRFTCFRHDPDDDTSINNDTTYSVYEDSSDRLWVTTKAGLGLMDEARTGRFERFMPDFGLLGVLERPQEPGIFWLGGSRGGVIRFDTETGGHGRYEITDEGWISGISQDPVNPNVLWVTSMGGGFGRFDLRSKTFLKYVPEPGDPNALRDDLIWDVYTDRTGIVWIGTRNHGVVRFNPSAVALSHIRHDPSNQNSLFGESVWRIQQEADGSLWVTVRTDQGNYAVSHINREANSYRHFFGEPGAPEVVHLVDQQGNVWGSSREQGICVYNPDSGRFEYLFEHDPEDPNSLPSNFVFDIHEDDTGILWLATAGGFVRLDPPTGRIRRFEVDDTDPTKLSRLPASIFEDQTGVLWLATRNGLNRLDPVTGRISRYQHDPSDTTSIASNGVTSVMGRRQEPGVIWVGTSGAGLSRLDVSTGRFTHFSTKDGLPNNVVYDILEDARGRLWMSTNHGLSRFDPETREFRNYGLEAGLQALEFNLGAAHKGPYGEMFFGGINGLNAFFPNELSENSEPPELAIVDLKLSNESVRETKALDLDAPIEEIDQIHLDPDQKELRIDYIAFHYENPELTEYAYKLEGFNDDWIAAGTDRSASYTNLAPGEYTFRVKAANSDGVWNEEGIALGIIVEPPFWATWWFRLFAILAIGGAVYGGYRLRVKQIASRAEKLEGEVERRTSELKATNTQLEQSYTIVEAINQETSFTRLLTKILEEARVISGIEKATALVYSHEQDRFYVRASSGWDVGAMKDIRLTRRQARDRYVVKAEEVAEDIFVAKNVAEREGSDQLAEFGKVASFLVLRVRVEDEIVAYLVFDNLHDEDAFDQHDVDLLERLRAHIASAFIKTRILEELQNERANLQSALDDLRSTQDRLLQSEKMASLGQLTAGIAHEIKNPLNFVTNFSEVTAEIASDLKEQLTKRKGELPDHYVSEIEAIVDDLLTNASKVKEHGRRADGIVQNMLEHSKIGEGQRTQTDLNELLDEYVTLAQYGLKVRDGDFDVRIERDFDENIGRIEVVPQDMGRVFMNLIGNAFDALKENREWRVENGGEPRVTVSTSRISGDDLETVEIRISDNGPGIPENVRARIFEPFFTTKPTGSGTGLGLSMSYDIVTKGHGGELDVVSTPGEGATFIVRLPI